MTVFLLLCLCFQDKPAPTYAAIRDLPLETRKEIYNGLEPQQQANLWKAHFEFVLANETLNEKQKTHLNEMIETVENGLFIKMMNRDELSDEETLKINDLMRTMRLYFTPQKARDYFATLGRPIDMQPGEGN